MNPTSHPMWNPWAGPIWIYGGRPCQASGPHRQRHANRAWGWCNVYEVRYLDDQAPHGETVTAARFNKGRRLLEAAR